MPGLLATARDLFLPRLCAGCGDPGTWWCEDCEAACAPEAHARVLAPGFVAAGAVPYAGAGRRAVLAHKNGRIQGLRPILAGWLGEALDVVTAGRTVVLVPMPPTRRSRQARGFDPVREVADAAALARGLRVAPALRWVRQPQPQKLLRRSARAANVHGRMAGSWLPDPVVLVDDVVTTGATLVEARRALETSGTAVTGAAVVCYAR